MKELSIKQKAQRYDEAIERANSLLSGNQLGNAWIYKLLPELKESEESKDERIRKALIDGFIVMKESKNCGKTFSKYKIPVEDILAWLEKLGKGDMGISEAAKQELENNLNKALEKETPESYNEFLDEQGEQNYKIIKGKNYFCVKTHNYAGVEWIKGTKYYASDNYTLVNQGCECYCPEYSKEEHNNLFEEVKYNGCVEKQGEQKSADKVEPKFHEGEWITNGNYTWKIVEVKPLDYILQSQDGNIVDDTISYVDEQFHSFTIKDAKDGDVLAWDNSKCIALFKNIYYEDSFNSYGFVGGCTGTFESRQSYHDIEGAHPATKEQRDLLFEKMEEAGYMWDSKNKELQKIEQKLDWSEEDEKTIHLACEFIRHHSSLIDTIGGIDCSILIERLKSLKHIVQPKQEWSKEDEKIYQSIMDDTVQENQLDAKQIDWLKSLKDRYTWKPSDEQMQALSNAGNSFRPFEEGHKLLWSLYNDLKKLREE